MAAGDPREYTGDLAVRHELRFFKRCLNTLNRGINVDDHAAFQAVTFGNPKACQLELPTGHDLGYHRHYF